MQGDDDDMGDFEDDGPDVDEDGDHLHAHFVSVQFCTQFIWSQNGAPSREMECMKCAPELQWTKTDF